MKKIFNAFLCTLCTVTIFSCQKEIDQPERPGNQIITEDYTLQTFTAISDATKTTVNGSGETVWSTSDQIKVVLDDGTAVDADLTDGANTTTGIFAGMVPNGKTALYAVYPAAAYTSVSGSTVNVAVAAEQAGTFAAGNIAVAKVASDNSMSFNNVNSFLVFQLKSGSEVTKVEVTSVDGSALVGTVPVDCSGATPTAGAATSPASTVSMTTSGEGTYYMSIASGSTHAKGLKMTYYKGTVETGVYYLNRNMPIAANRMYTLGEVETDRNYYVSLDGAGTKDGMSWTNAMSASTMWKKIHLAGTDADTDAAKFAAINGATFNLAAGTYNWGAGAEINIAESETVTFTIKGESGTIFTGDDDADGTGDHRILTLGGNMNVTFNGIRFEKGNATDGNGGAVNINGGKWTFTGCTFSGNEAKDNGGAINISGGSATIYKSTFSGNEAGGNGGAINVAEGTKVEILKAASNNQFTSNVAEGKGGAVNIESKNGDLLMSSETPTNRINYADFKKNHANYGGAVAICGESGKTSRVFFSNCTMGTSSSSNANYATVDGGAIYFEGECFVNVGNSTMRGNNAKEKGGSICVVGWGMLQLYRSYFNKNYAKTGGVVYTTGADSKKADFFVDECSFEANYITEHYGCVFNLDGINQFSMYNSSARNSYTTGTGKKDADKKGLCPSWIAIDKVQDGGCVSMANCSVIGDTWHGTDDAALTDGTALIAIWGSQTNYFTNCIIAPETVGSIAAIRGDGDQIIDLYYTHYSNVGNIGTNTDSGGNTTGRISTDFGSLSWASNCWQWNGEIAGSAPSMANQSGVYNRLNTICPDFVTWSGSDINKDQLGEDRGNGDWWPGAYQN